MQELELSTFTRGFMGMSELYGKPLSSLLVEIYWQTLRDFEWEDVQRAFKAHARNPDCGQYFPKPADVVRFIEGSGETKALEAWSKVEDAIYHVGSYQSLAFDDAIIHAVLEDMGGWVKLCMVSLEELPFRSHEFQKRYRGFVDKPLKRYPQYLWGIAECENAKNGYPLRAPLLVGDFKKAEQVMLGGKAKPLCIESFNPSIMALIQQDFLSVKEQAS